MRTFIIVACLFVAGCISSTKTVIFDKDSINLHPLPAALQEVEGQSENPGEMVLPDGSYITLSGGGSAGNLTLVVMQNDGTEQTTRGQASAAATVNSPSSTTGTTSTAGEEEVTE